MQVSDIAQLRLINQHLATPVFSDPADLVFYMGAMQAQDYAAAKWAVAQRLQDAADDLIEKAFTSGNIIRTHVMRPTWHFVHPADIRWMLELNAPRVMKIASTYQRQLGLDHAVFLKCEKALAHAMEGGKQLMRAEILEVLQQAGIGANEQRFIHIMMQMELTGLVCSGGRRGKQFTYTLLEERVPPVKAFDRQDALAALAERYFTAHGPATLQDYVWWSGLTIADAKAGIGMIKDKLKSSNVGQSTFWFAASAGASVENAPAAYLLPNYDEFIVSYKDRSAAIAAEDMIKNDPRGTIFNHTILVHGRVVGIWKRRIGKNNVDIMLNPFAPQGKANHAAILSAAKRYVRYLGLKEFNLHIS
jgi:hypothetical protein